MMKPEPATLHRMFYRSRATAAAESNLDPVVEQIINSSIINNYTVGVTGLLLVVKGYFIQVLEGETNELRSTYARISLDRRHQDLHIIAQGPAEERLFGDWNMCARTLKPSDRLIVDALGGRENFNPKDMSAPSIERLLLNVATLQRRSLPAEYL